jgi:hypothetical protein
LFVYAIILMSKNTLATFMITGDSAPSFSCRVTRA